MTEYRRAWHPGVTWFVTVNLAERRGNRLLVERIDVLRTAFRSVRARHPFQLEAIVILPDHLHCVWTLASGDFGLFYPLESDQGTLLPCHRKRRARFAKPGQAG
jgi:REP element-mobilizing transposase RayT